MRNDFFAKRSRSPLYTFIVLILIYAAAPVLAAGQASQVLGSTVLRSPNRALAATIISLKQVHAYGDSPSRVQIRKADGHQLASLDFSTYPDQGYTVKSAAWTADSRFFVCTVSSSGGHSPWHRPIFYYSRNRNRFYSLDLALKVMGHGPGEITEGMELRSPCILVTQGRYYGKSHGGLRVRVAGDGSGEKALAINLEWLDSSGKRVQTAAFRRQFIERNLPVNELPAIGPFGQLSRRQKDGERRRRRAYFQNHFVFRQRVWINTCLCCGGASPSAEDR
jgi:hypothetical protein